MTTSNASDTPKAFSSDLPPDFPQDFCQRIDDIYAEAEQAQIYSSFQQKSDFGFRINTLQWAEDEADQALQQQGFEFNRIQGIPGARVMARTQRDALIASEFFDDGRIYVQNISSMLAPVALNALAGQTVLDLAAAPGGKTTMIAAMMKNQGILSAVEPVKGRFFKLKANLDRAGVEFAKCYMVDGRAVGTKTPERFDRILLDAPCSSEARFQFDEPKSWAHWNTRKVKECAKKQKRLILSAFHALKPGGKMIYCTCSFSPEENELVVASLIKRYPDDVIIEVMALPSVKSVAGITEWKGKALPDALRQSQRVIPDQLVDGFFLCQIKKRNDEDGV